MVDLNVMATNIKSILEQVPGIRSAFDHEPQTISQLPAATLYFDNFNQSEKTSMRTEVKWSWTVRLYIPLSTSDVKSPQLKTREYVTNAIKQLRGDITLGGSCYYHSVFSGEVFALLDQTNPMMVAELNLVATTEDDM